MAFYPKKIVRITGQAALAEVRFEDGLGKRDRDRDVELLAFDQGQIDVFLHKNLDTLCAAIAIETIGKKRLAEARSPQNE